MVDRYFDRCRSPRAVLWAAMVGLALGNGQLAAQAPDLPGSPGQVQPPELPSKGAPPPRVRIASRQSPSGEGPLPPGLMNKTPRLEDLPNTQSSPGFGPVALTGRETVVRVIIDPPLKHVKEQDARRHIKTKADRPYDPRTVEEDARRLMKSKLFAAVDPKFQRVGENGIIVIYNVVERPLIKYLRFFGNEKVKERHLRKQSGLKVGDPWDPYLVEDARSKVEEYYREKGYNKIKVVIIEGNRKEDRGVVYLVNEGQKQRISKVEFVGNNVASDGRLKTQIQTKPPLLYLFKGEVDRQKIEEDVGRLYDYYRGLGYFRAKIFRELSFNPDQNWLTVRFIIDEGPRYKVRNVSFVGQKVFTADALGDKLKLKAGDYYDKSKLDRDRTTVTDKYGVRGYVFAVVQPEQSFQGDPNELDQIDIVYQIEEGGPCIVSRVDVKIAGDNPHTRRNTILNRVDMHPGDLLSTRKLRDSERRLKASQLFKTTPGDEPRITFERPKLNDEEGLAERPGRGTFRGQSPDRRGAP
ncbi:MAG TPA: POTRA domain-containing protein [Pirellulales bacterium]|jgi:outer membrane protein insertion porin family|nr:POTRA domain-containing protein [Pirellulales bacterium]